MMRADYTERPLQRYLMSVLYSLTRLLFLVLKDRYIGTITGLENLPPKGPVIVVANHLSYMDNFLLAYVFDRHYGEKLYVPTNVKAFSWFLKSFWHLASGGVPIDPKKPEEAYETLQRLLKDGKSILLFPEGTRSDGTKLLPFKFGAFNLARNTGTSIVPCALIDTHKVLPKHRLYFIKGQRASVSILPVIDTGSLASSPVAEVKEACREAIARIVLTRDPKPAVSGRSAAHLALKAEEVVEGVIEDGVESMKSARLKPVLLWHELAAFTQEDTHDVEVQYVRAAGFRLLAAPKFVAPFLIHPFLRLCQEALRKDPRQPFIHYVMGQFYLRAPSLFGGSVRKAAVSIDRSYRWAAHYGIGRERFAVSYADALVHCGNTRRAKTVLARHFLGEGPTFADTTPRLLRRRDRAMAVLARIH